MHTKLGCGIFHISCRIFIPYGLQTVLLLAEIITGIVFLPAQSYHIGTVRDKIVEGVFLVNGLQKSKVPD